MFFHLWWHAAQLGSELVSVSGLRYDARGVASQSRKVAGNLSLSGLLAGLSTNKPPPGGGQTGRINFFQLEMDSDPSPDVSDDRWD